MHSSGQHIDYDLLMLYLTREADTQQVEKVEEWLASSEENKVILDELEKLWIETGKIAPPPVAVDADAAWNKVFSKIKPEEDKIIQLQTESEAGKSILRIITRIAAILIIVIGGYGVFRLISQDVEQVTLTSTEVAINQVLPDESKIDLNEDSKISYPEKFTGKTREVKLEGEAYFDVTENKEKPFVIRTEIADITVLGTTFNVKAYPETNIVEVIVETGKVQLSDNTVPKDSAESLILEAGTMGIIDKNTGKFEKITNANKNKLFWKTNKMVFQGTRLTDVFVILEDHFNVTIKAENPNIENCPLTVTFENHGIDYILDIIAGTMELTYRKENNAYIFEGNECN